MSRKHLPSLSKLVISFDDKMETSTQHNGLTTDDAVAGVDTCNDDENGDNDLEAVAMSQHENGLIEPLLPLTRQQQHHIEDDEEEQEETDPILGSRGSTTYTTTTTNLHQSTNRLESVDVLRGIVMAVMILVDDAGPGTFTYGV